MTQDDRLGDGANECESRSNRSCDLIVGVGASAGGLEAFERLLRHLPPDESMALVYVQHLDPTRDSALPELLGRHAQVPVEVIHDQTTVEPGRVYVIPPNTSLTLRGGGCCVSVRACRNLISGSR
jgi:two-component system, chemotaxis family, CheB/CheR fusion protein